MKIVVAAVQMPSDPLDVSANLDRADELLRSAHESCVELAVLPELFNTGYSLCPDYGPYSETVDGPTFATCGSAVASGKWRSPRVSSSGKGGISTIRWFSALRTVTCRSIASATSCSGNGFDSTRADRRWSSQPRGDGSVSPFAPT